MTVETGIRRRLEAALVDAVRRLGVDGDLPDLELGRARTLEHGDYASPAGMKLARVLRQPPPQIAARLAETIAPPDGAVSVEAVGGYVNFRLTPTWLQRAAAEIAASGAEHGKSDLGHGERVQVEFGSINPTGPLHVGHGRGTILGDSIARLLSFTGHAVHREYYVNDQNTQARRFVASVWARMHGEEPPEGGYTGEYVVELADQARRELPGIGTTTFDEAEPRLRDFAIGVMVERIRATVARLQVYYDDWFHESRVWEEGLPQLAMDRLRKAGYLKEHSGALWFATPGSHDEDEEEEEGKVVIRSNGEPTYFASDLGYLLSRFEQRKFQRVIEVWASDHHGYVGRMKEAATALGFDPDKLVVILNQMVNLREGSSAAGAAGSASAKMSKRAGRFVTLDELIDRVGADAVRYFYLLRSPDTTIEFDLELALTRGNENPLYYAQYAHARLVNVETTAAERHARLPDQADVSLLAQAWELDVARQLAYWPDVVEEAAKLLEPHRIPYYAHDLAGAVHRFYHAGNEVAEHRVVVDDPALTRARLELCRAARQTLKSALDLIGVSAPERM